MIIGFFIQIITSVTTFFVSLLPVYDLPSEWITAVTLIWGYINSVSWLLPISTLLQVLGLAVFFHATIFVWHLSFKLYHMIRG